MAGVFSEFKSNVRTPKEVSVDFHHKISQLLHIRKPQLKNSYVSNY